MLTPELFRLMLKSWRASIPRRYRKRTGVPKVDFRFPSQIERKYAQFLERLYKAYTQPLLTRIKPILEQATRKDSLHADAYDPNQLDFLFGDLEKLDTQIFYDYNDPNVYRGRFSGVEEHVASFGWDTSTFNTEQWKKLVGVAIPSYMLEDEPWMREAVDNWAKLNATLIDGDAGQFYAKAESIIRSAVQTGRRAEDVMVDLLSLESKLTRNRAKFIARDQIGTLTGIMTQKRSESVGLDLYTWRTAMDERVRGRPNGKWEYTDYSHWLMEGKICKWNDSTVYSNDGKTWHHRSELKAVVTYHAKTFTGTRGKPEKAAGAGKSKVATAPIAIPGAEPNCRCGSRAFLGNLLEELDAELAEAGL